MNYTINIPGSPSFQGDWLPYVVPVLLVIWLFVLGSLLRRIDLDAVTKLMWVIVVIFVPFFGVLFYWFIEPWATAAQQRKTDAKQPRQPIADSAGQLSGTPWQDDPGHTLKGR